MYPTWYDRSGEEGNINTKPTFITNYTKRPYLIRTLNLMIPISPTLGPALIKSYRGYRKERKERKEEEERLVRLQYQRKEEEEREREAEHERERNAKIRIQRLQEAAQREKEREDREEREKEELEERERQAKKKRDDEALEREIQRLGELEAQRKEEEIQRRAGKEREKKAREEQEREAQVKRDEEREKAMTRRLEELMEELEKEKRERREGETEQDLKFENLKNNVEEGIKKMIFHFMNRQRESAYTYRRKDDEIEYYDDEGQNYAQLLEGQNYAQLLDSHGLDAETSHVNKDLPLIMPLLQGATQAKDEGNVYFKNQNYDEAIQCYTRSLSITPTTVAYCNRALAFLKTNKFLEAEKDCTDTLTIDDQFFKAYARRAMARKELGRNLKGALKDTEVALQLEPNSLDVKVLRAQLEEILG